eukprot:m.357820 g.357820  ORF g.357820 m.357820 type:complete len:282 (-) comp17948_c0_seq1:265-1110(-)
MTGAYCPILIEGESSPLLPLSCTSCLLQFVSTTSRLASCQSVIYIHFKSNTMSANEQIKRYLAKSAKAATQASTASMQAKDNFADAQVKRFLAQRAQKAVTISADVTDIVVPSSSALASIFAVAGAKVATTNGTEFSAKVSGKQVKGIQAVVGAAFGSKAAFTTGGLETTGEVDQWVALALRLDGKVTKHEALAFFQNLNASLGDGRQWLVNDTKTLADFVVWERVAAVLPTLDYVLVQHFHNMLRWVDFVQNDAQLNIQTKTPVMLNNIFIRKQDTSAQA